MKGKTSISFRFFTQYSADGDASDPNMKFPKFCSQFEEDLWSPTYNKTGKFFVRKQTQNNPKGRDVNESDIVLHDLMKLVDNDKSEGMIWYHATSWQSAIKKLEEGPRLL
jgi:hypothetical protein